MALIALLALPLILGQNRSLSARSRPILFGQHQLHKVSDVRGSAALLWGVSCVCVFKITGGHPTPFQTPASDRHLQGSSLCGDQPMPQQQGTLAGCWLWRTVPTRGPSQAWTRSWCHACRISLCERPCGCGDCVPSVTHMHRQSGHPRGPVAACLRCWGCLSSRQGTGQLLAMP